MSLLDKVLEQRQKEAEQAKKMQIDDRGLPVGEKTVDYYCARILLRHPLYRVRERGGWALMDEYDQQLCAPGMSIPRSRLVELCGLPLPRGDDYVALINMRLKEVCGIRSDDAVWLSPDLLWDRQTGEPRQVPSKYGYGENHRPGENISQHE